MRWYSLLVVVCHTLQRAEVTVYGANVEACNGVYHDEESSKGSPQNHGYENNSGGIIYFDGGQWRIKTQTSPLDFIYAIDSNTATPPVGKWSSKDGHGHCNVEATPIAIDTSPFFVLCGLVAFGRIVALSNHCCANMFVCEVGLQQSLETFNADFGVTGMNGKEHPANLFYV